MVMIGVITDIKGYRGEMFVTNLLSENINLPENLEVNIGYSEKFSRKYTLSNWRSGKKTAKMRLEGVNSEINAVELLENGIFVDEDALKVGNPNMIFFHELSGLEVINNETQEIIGTVYDLLEMPANDVLEIDCGDSILKIPFVDEFIIKIDKDDKKIFLNLPNSYELLLEKK